MNRTKLKNYAPQARRDFIQAVTDRAATYGLAAKKTEPMTESGDVVLIGGKAFPKSVGEKRRKLEASIAKDGFGQTMEALAYLWFNRFAAIRYMELHGYLDHGFRVLSHPQGQNQPEILEKAQHVTLPGLDSKKVLELKLDGTKEEELYRLLLTAQCNALHSAMPFLFERIEDETELLLPDNLLHSDSLIRKLVNEIDEEDWKEVEIIGWLYQFYISERKDEVIGKVVASEDIPAATQLFTPNWIVKYLVQNTLGRQWLATYPESSLRQQMEYYIEPAEQTPEVQEQLKAITPTSLNPEELTLLDPACGSGHILVEAYDLFKAIYQERGYRAKDIPALILQKNLFGLEIDDRAAQLAAFALMMKARADDRRIFDGEAKPNIIALQESKGLDPAAITHALNSPINQEDGPKEFLFEELQEEKDGLFSKKAMAQKGHVSKADIAALVDLFEHAKTFGSLIQVSNDLAAKLPEIEERLNEVLENGDLTHVPAQVLKPLLLQAGLLARKYDAVVANPPYMGNRYIQDSLKIFLKSYYDGFNKDLYSAFIERNRLYCGDAGNVGMMSPFTWMFISMHQTVRETLITKASLTSLVQLEYSGFSEATVPICAYTYTRRHIKGHLSSFIRLIAFRGADQQGPRTLQAIADPKCGWFYTASPDEFQKVPGSPIAYWISDKVRNSFDTMPSLGSIADSCNGIQTGNNERFTRLWYEVSQAAMGSRWFPYAKGGDYRRWFGNVLNIVDWENDGRRIKDQPNCCIRGEKHYFSPGITWSDITSARLSFRYLPPGALFDAKGPTAFVKNETTFFAMLGLLNSEFVHFVSKLLNPTLSFQSGDFRKIPVSHSLDQAELSRLARQAVAISELDWSSLENSPTFSADVVCEQRSQTRTVAEGYQAWRSVANSRTRELTEVQDRINALVNAAYDFDPDQSEPPPPLFVRHSNEEEDIKRLLSYVVGCIMGRYSLDKPGLIYAHSGNQGFDPGQYQTFRADDDGIIPLLDNDWGIRDDATNRFEEFIGIVWPKENLEENLKFVADSLDPESKENARDTIRHYLSTGFYKHHLSMYKKRPIYWLFSSGKQKAFQCLVYLHRYNEGTLSRMRTEYVIPLLGKMNGRLQQLDGDITASSATGRRKLEKERDTLKKQLAELQEFDARLRHYADLRIKLDLDDGVKVNYGKFSDPKVGDILAEVKAICGTKDED